jgi:CubicO group peptidase (beta-lactamase class C family)
MTAARIPTCSWTFLLALPIALTLSGCASVRATAPTNDDPHQALRALAERNHVCAAAIAVIKHGKLASMDAASGCVPAPRLSSDSVFQAASLSKPVFAYAVMKLVEQGRLGLDTPVMKYLPQGYRHRFDPLKAAPSDLVTDKRLQDVTVRMILNHTSGLPNWASGPLEFDTPPGTRWQYSGEGYVLLQRAVEQVTGLPLDRFMEKQVFAPLGMNNSSYVWDQRLSARLLPGTKANGAPRSTLLMTSPVAAFSLSTSAADYAKFLVTVLNDTALTTDVTSSPAVVDKGLGLAWGLGWGIEDSRDERYIWQWGNNPGYRGFVIASPRTKDGFVMLTNGENGLALAEPMVNKILGGEHTLFQSSILGTDVLNFLCNTVRICL